MSRDSASPGATRRGPRRVVVRSRCILLGALLAWACGGSPPAEHPAPAAARAAEPSAGCRPGTSPAAAGERRQLAGRTVLLDAPAGASDRPAPLVLALHGFRSSPEDMRDGTGLAELARTDGVVVAYPAGPRRGAAPGDERRRLGHATDRDDGPRLRSRPARPARARDLHRPAAHLRSPGCRTAASWRACSGVSSPTAWRRWRRSPARSTSGPAQPARPVPILLLYGTADTVVPPDLIRGGIAWWTRQNACGASAPAEGCMRWSGCAADVVACEGPQAHRWPADATGRIWHFFSTHVRP